MTTLELFRLKTYPYGYRTWLNRVWQECRRKGIVSKDTTSIDMRIDPDGWLHYFMEGIPPIEAVNVDIKEQS